MAAVRAICLLLLPAVAAVRLSSSAARMAAAGTDSSPRAVQKLPLTIPPRIANERSSVVPVSLTIRPGMEPVLTPIEEDDDELMRTSAFGPRFAEWGDSAAFHTSTAFEDYLQAYEPDVHLR